MKKADEIFNSMIGKTETYTPVDYLESDNRGQWIDTGYTPNQDTRVVTTWMKKTGGNFPIMGAVRSTIAWWLLRVNFPENMFRFFYGGTNYNTGIAIVINQWTTIDIDRNVINITINGVSSTYTTPTNEFTAATTLALFASKSQNQNPVLAPQLFQRTQIYDNSTLALDLQPNIRNSDGVAGMLDVVNGIFHTNANPAGDNFLYGNIT